MEIIPNKMGIITKPETLEEACQKASEATAPFSVADYMNGLTREQAIKLMRAGFACDRALKAIQQ